MMRFAEEFLLLLRNEDGALSGAAEWLVRPALGAAVLMDLAAERRIDTDAGGLFLIDSTPVGDPLLDPILAEIAAAKKSHSALYWVDHASRHADEIRETALAGLTGKKVLELKDDRFLWIFGTRRYVLLDAAAESALVERIRSVLLTDELPHPNDVVIITLADGCGLITTLLAPDERARAGPRLELVRKMDLIGRAFLKAMEVAVMPAAGKIGSD